MLSVALAASLSLAMRAGAQSARVDTSRATTGGAVHTLRVVSPDGQPVVYANVSIGGGGVQITNEKGELALGPGRLHAAKASVRRIGFTPWFGTLDFPDTTSVVTIELAYVAQNLGEVKVTGRKAPSSPFVQGFYDRWLDRQKGLLSATFIGPEELEFRHPDLISNVLRGLNGVTLVNYGHMKLIAMSAIVQNCEMAIVVDGKQHYPDLIPGSRPPQYAVFIDEIVPADEVMGIEVYPRGGNMPISLQVDDTRCGVIAFWTGSRR